MESGSAFLVLGCVIGGLMVLCGYLCYRMGKTNELLATVSDRFAEKALSQSELQLDRLKMQLESEAGIRSLSPAPRRNFTAVSNNGEPPAEALNLGGPYANGQ